MYGRNRYHETINYQKIRRKKYILENKEIIKFKNKRIEDPAFKLKANVSRSIRTALHKNGKSKNNFSFLKYVRYSMQELKIHLEKQFESWMTWNNWGIYNPKIWDDSDTSTWTWQIDHIIPQSFLLYTSMEDENFKTCWALENLRPLSSKQNFQEGIKLPKGKKL